MSEFRITNCHVHAFTLDHVPDGFAPPFLMPVLRRKPVRKAASWVLRNIWPFDHRDRFERMAQYARITAELGGQEGVIRHLRGYYPENTRFVVLPMDLGHAGAGTPPVDLPAQHDELARIAKDPALGPSVVPFATIHPDRPGAFDEFRRCVEEQGFRGLKLYPPLGFPPDHKLLMDRAYPYCVENGLPVITHCSRGGVKHRRLSPALCESYASPHAFAGPMRAFPELRVCLAHFGGATDWQAYLENSIPPGDPDARRANWLTAIRDMIGCGDYPNLYTDISYTIFYFTENLPALAVFLEDEILRSRVLFGSDFYMAEQERFPERSLSIRLRYALGGEAFEQLAHANVERWLGERPSPPTDAPAAIG